MLFNFLSLVGLGRPVQWWEKALTRYCGKVIIRVPPSDPEKFGDPEWDCLMALHYCGACRTYRFDIHRDPVSRMERYECGGCGKVNFTSVLSHMKNCFYLSELIRVAKEVSAECSTYFWWEFALLRIFGLGEHLPEDRGGKSTGQLADLTVFEDVYLLFSEKPVK